MNAQRPDKPDADREAEASPAGPPRVLVWGKPADESPGFFRRLMGRLRGHDEPDTGALEHGVAPAVFRPPAARRPPRAAPSVDAPSPRSWDPPDLSVDDPEPSVPTEPVPAAAAPTPAAEPRGHGPGPLYRATLQLLPGRLRPLDPDVVREEIRFVRPSGRSAVVTLGWADGEPPDHVTLNHPSVQDRHARMSFVDRRWWIESLVPGHLVRINGEPLSVEADPVELQSGDEVRLGDARFHFVMP